MRVQGVLILCSLLFLAVLTRFVVQQPLRVKILLLLGEKFFSKIWLKIRLKKLSHEIRLELEHTVFEYLHEQTPEKTGQKFLTYINFLSSFFFYCI
jgi:predicted membrane metal-binding protein